MLVVHDLEEYIILSLNWYIDSRHKISLTVNDSFCFPYLFLDVLSTSKEVDGQVKFLWLALLNILGTRIYKGKPPLKVSAVCNLISPLNARWSNGIYKLNFQCENVKKYVILKANVTETDDLPQPKKIVTNVALILVTLNKIAPTATNLQSIYYPSKLYSYLKCHQLIDREKKISFGRYKVAFQRCIYHIFWRVHSVALSHSFHPTQAKKKDLLMT